MLPIIYLTLSLIGVTADTTWSTWRGNDGNGVSPKAEPPLKWDESTNIRWKYKIPGFGSSSPVVWQDQIFLTTAVPTGKKVEGQDFEAFQFITFSVSRKDGKVLWQKVSKEEAPHEGHHKDHGFASASCATDGQHVISSFGSRGIFCYDLKGNLVWEKDLGDMKTRNNFGEGSSPALHENTVIIVWDHEGDSFIVALDKLTGKELWRKFRTEKTSWGTPLIRVYDGKAQAIVNATGKVRSYDVKTGEVLWESGGQTANAIPSPVSQKDWVYVMSGFRGATLHAIRLGKTGDLTGTENIAWSHKKGTPYVPSPLLYEDSLYFYSGNQALLSNFNVKTGQPFYEMQRVEGISGVYASPVAAAGRVYLPGRDGNTVVIKHGPTLEILALNKLDDRFDASPALIEKDLLLRGHQFLYCIAEK